MPRAKAKQKLIDTRNETYHETELNVCAVCKNFWNAERPTCRLLSHTDDGWAASLLPVVPWGTCDLFQRKGE